MTSPVTLEQVEGLANRLSLPEQLQLIAGLSARLSSQVLEKLDEDRQRREYMARVDAFLQKCEEIAPEPAGPVDSAADIRQIREERLERICGPKPKRS
jgi:hypothetical protein